MTGIDVTAEALEQIRDSLRRGAESVEGALTGAPAAVDAGVLSPVVAQALARLTQGAAAVSEGLMAAADGVAANTEGYWTTDETVRRDFEPRGTMP